MKRMWINDILKENRKILALSPMADMTDSPFCQVVRQIGGADIVYREMVSSEALVRENKKTLDMTDFVQSERPIVQQIFGSDPHTMAKAASIVMEHANPEGIDINMGCPVYKITSNFNGCALMKDPDLATAIIKEMKKAIYDTPLSVKIRLGWSDPDDYLKFIPVIEDAGADLITIHGRTKAQGYSGVSDWERIGKAKQIAKVPLIANGDIHKPHQVQEALEITKADGVLIARGALGNPWFFQQAKCHSRVGGNPTTSSLYLQNDLDSRSRSGMTIETIPIQERKRVVLEHARLHILRYGEKGMVTFRKHLAWYFKTDRIGFEIPGIKDIRMQLMKISTYQELEEILKQLH